MNTPYPLYSRFGLGAKGELLVLHLFEDAPGKLAIPVRFGRIAGTSDNGDSAEIADGVLHLSGLKPMSALVLLLR